MVMRNRGTKNRVRSKITRNRRKMMNELDAAARQEVFARDGFKCVRCGTDKSIQWSHVFSRRHLCLRWVAENAKTLCVGCHCWWGNFPYLAFEWFRKNWPERWATINSIYQANPKVNVKDKWQQLQQSAS